MTDVHTISLKIGASHGLWQYKHAGTHERIIVAGLRPVLDAACRLLGFSFSDRSVVYLLSFSPEPFDAWQVCLEKSRELPDGCSYHVVESNIGTFSAQGQLPGAFKTAYLGKWTARLYLRIVRSLTGTIVD